MKGETRITEANIAEAVKQVRMVLLEADVNYKVVKSFIAAVQEQAMGEDVLKSVSPAQQFIKIVHDNLVDVLGGSNYDPSLHLASNPPTIIMLCGLQGSGKTTSAGKLAKFFTKNRKDVLLVAADIYRPAAIDQLEVLGKNTGVDVYFDKISKDAVKIVQDGLAFSRKAAKDVVIIDTAGRLHIDETLMDEIEQVKKVAAPHYILFVADAMTGQDAVNAASVFNDKLDITGVMLTKVDGDSRGGAALSIRYATGKPIIFIGVGERSEELELFHPDRMASRILGMGDIVSLVEKAQNLMDEEDAKVMAGKVKTGLDFEDLLKQFKMMKKMGSVQNLLGMIPGFSKLNVPDVDESKFLRIESIIYSMTLQERRKPDIINGSRKKRIAAGSGVSVTEVNRLMDQLTQMNKLFKKFGRKMGAKPDMASINELTRFMKSGR